MIIQPSQEALEFLAHGNVPAWNGWIREQRQIHSDPQLGIDLQGRDLRGVRLREADLKFADCSGADFSDADLSGADAEETIFFGAKFINSRLQGIRLQGANLQNADLRGAEFAEVETENAIGIAVAPIPGQAPLVLTNRGGKIHVQPREGGPVPIAAYVRDCLTHGGAEAREVVPALTLLLQSKKGGAWAEALRAANGALRQQSVLEFLRTPTRIVSLIPQARTG